MKIILQPTTTAEWYELIRESQHHIGLFFDDHVESYLILTLDKFIKEEIHNETPIAIEFLSSISMENSHANQKLRKIGDRCLILAGLFPEHAEKVNVSTTYFIDMGQQAYLTLADRARIKTDPKLFYKLGFQFIDIKSVLNTMRSLSS
ncbi:MAG: hypothetical protein A3F17_03755 [Gammaproteobacteria bacterium RIFCSPHIGHO2_12_FULL_41_15]|nr:MAG: hypothetical protein A3F17_03755 [Gammaproteobacteria bacterium RIFCSPHIGHO2_12_FULL_41_15]